ncbi:MAG: heparan-alpha-glucosaminide N-acetyltransferase domain-containing protein, partial [Promethearchaeota archaeon]
MVVGNQSEAISLKEGAKEEEKFKRYLSIDVFKGITILLMTFVNTLSVFENLPAWSKHPVDYGLTYVDFIAHFFVFIMGLN